MTKIGLDVGSTTLKAVVLDEKDNIIYQKYERHYSKISEKAAEMLTEIAALPGLGRPSLSISGSRWNRACRGLRLTLCTRGLRHADLYQKLCPEIDTVIELGGEDAKSFF